jgi:predicted Mrr-cat superfamily restriction endonuclease
MYNYSEDAVALARDCIKARLREAKPDLSEKSIHLIAGQIYRFAQEMKEGDFVLTPIRPTPKVLMGKVVGPYVFDPHYADGYISAHTRCVEWLKTVLREEFSVPFNGTLRSNPTVFFATQHIEEFFRVLQQ